VQSAKAADAPSNIPTPFIIQTSIYSITIGWTVPDFTGYSEILGYQVFWNGGGSGAIIPTPIYDTRNATILTYTLVPPMLVAG